MNCFSHKDIAGNDALHGAPRFIGVSSSKADNTFGWHEPGIFRKNDGWM
jgi:hypothetical protein